MNAWDHLPNAKLIDRVLASLKEHADLWDASRKPSFGTAWKAAWNAAWGAAWDASRNEAWKAADTAAWKETDNATMDAAWHAAWHAILALIAYDDAAKYLDMTASELEMWATLSQDPAAILLLPAVRVFESTNELSRT